MRHTLFVGDIHLSDRPPSTRTETYREDIFAKLEEIGWIARDRDAGAIILLGDLFHSKVPRNTSHETVRRLIETIRDWPTEEVWCVPGNHDYRAANPRNILSGPLGVVWGTKTVRRIDGDFDSPVEINGVVYFAVREEQPIEEFGRAYGADVVVSHSPILPGGDRLPWDAWSPEQVAAVLPPEVALVVNGHIHDPYGVYEVGDVDFAMPGSISRGSLFETNPERVPQVLLMHHDQEIRKLEFIELSSARPWTEVFRVEEVMAERERDNEAIEFAEMLTAAALEAFNVEGVIAKIKERDDVPEPVKLVAIELIEEQA